MSRRAVIYTRISKDREGAGLGVDRQREDCEALAESLGWAVVAHHDDNDMSAYSGKPRKGYQALLVDLAEGRADAVLVWHTDRLHRSPVELEHYIAVCGERVVTQTVKAGHLDLATPTGRMVARTLGGIARYEVEHMVERQQRAKAQAAGQGRWKGGRRPFGYEADGVTIREDEAAEVRRATDDLLAGMSLSAIARDWNARGVTTSTGGAWKQSETRKLLTRPRNAGLMEHRGEVVGAAGWPAIVEEDRWRAVRALVTDPARRTTTGNARRWLGGQLYRCGACDSPLRATSGGSRTGSISVPAYRCEQAAHVVRRCDQVDDYVTAVLVERLSRPDAAHLARPSATTDTTALHVERLAVQARLDELVDLHGAGMINGQQLQRGTAGARARLDDLDRQLAQSVTATALDGVAGPKAAEVWPTLDLSRKRAILDTIMSVTILRAHRGRPAGWRPGMPYFDPATVRINWKGAA